MTESRPLRVPLRVPLHSALSLNAEQFRTLALKALDKMAALGDDALIETIWVSFPIATDVDFQYVEKPSAEKDYNYPSWSIGANNVHTLIGNVCGWSFARMQNEVDGSPSLVLDTREIDSSGEIQLVEEARKLIQQCQVNTWREVHGASIVGYNVDKLVGPNK